MGEMPLGIRSLLGPITDLKSEDRILIITDTDKFQIGKELFDWASKVNETSMAVMTPRASHGDEPTVEIAAAMETANVIFAATSMSMFHSQARRRVVQNGHCRFSGDNRNIKPHCAPFQRKKSGTFVTRRNKSGMQRGGKGACD